MNSDKEKDCGCNNKEEGCCGNGNGENTEHVHGEGCGHDHDAEDGCGCGHEEHTVTLTLDDDTELECPILEAFDINAQGYIALLHPVDETVLLYRFSDNDDETIDIETIEADDEFELVSKTFLSLQED